MNPRIVLSRPRAQHGTSMIEVLVAIVIVVVGLLGLAGLQSRASLAEMESFQRAQALVLMQDMVDRINANRRNTAAYVTTTPLGTGTGAPADCSGMTVIATRDRCEWSNALLGAAETQGGSQVGAMIGARGCVELLSAAMPRRYRVAVVWQGLNPTAAPGATNCGSGQYGSNELSRRAVTTTITIGCLQNDPVTLACIAS
ncbi:MAG TPA: type IV pilus modification protein PilV [Usitatibacter sp.]|nr:type IV pilus modification protein PilV [Usitatibacter sp.]